MNIKKYELGPKAIFFYDPTNKKKILPGKQVGFTPIDLLSKRTQSAISTGHIRIAIEKVEDKEPVKLTTKQLIEKIKTQLNEHQDYEKVVKMFKKEELVSVAKELGFEVEEDDTKATLFESIVEDLLDEGPEE